jgi:predicted transcriptional regulator
VKGIEYIMCQSSFTIYFSSLICLKFKEVIAVNNKLEKVCDRYVTVLNNTLKPTKPFHKMMVEKHNVHPTKSQEKWQIRPEKEIVKGNYAIFVLKLF